MSVFDAPLSDAERRRETIRLRILTTTIVLGVLVWVGASIFAGASTPDSDGVDSYSRSAVGHRAFVALLEASGLPVRRSRFQSATAARPGELVVFAEPRISLLAPRALAPNEKDEDVEDAAAEDERDPAAALAASPFAGVGARLFVLPKRRDSGVKGELIDEAFVAATLRRIDPGARLARTPGGAFSGRGFTWTPPDLLQTVTPGKLEPVWLVPEGGVLLRLRREGGDWWVLSDPDLLATHGLAVAGVPAAAVALVRDAVPGGARGVVWDETLHGFEEAPTFWTRFSRPPLAFVLLHVALCAALAVWAGAVRFGPAEPEAEPTPEGRAGLLRLTAELLAAAPNGAAAAAARHADLRLRDAAARAGYDPRGPRAALAQAVDASPGAAAKPGAGTAWAAIAERLESHRGRRLPDSVVVEAAAELAARRSPSHGVGRGPHAR